MCGKVFKCIIFFWELCSCEKPIIIISTDEKISIVVRAKKLCTNKTRQYKGDIHTDRMDSEEEMEGEIKPMKRKKKWITAGAVLLTLSLSISIFFALVRSGTILLNNPSRSQYPIRGVDVSWYQGQIDWKTLASSGISFAFIKATEGSTHVDPCFQYNYDEARKTDLRIGAYHFFSYDSKGQTQADNYIAVVEKTNNMLPPVIDLEFYGDKEQNPPKQDQVREELTVMLNRLEEYYGMKPIIYATEKSYELYLADAFQEYDIWIRNVFSTPRLSDHRGWTFWQYTDREKLDGYQGDEKYIDMNVFNGSREDFLSYP